jgi:hypothetical protein
MVSEGQSDHRGVNTPITNNNKINTTSRLQGLATRLLWTCFRLFTIYESMTDGGETQHSVTAVNWMDRMMAPLNHVRTRMSTKRNASLSAPTRRPYATDTEVDYNVCSKSRFLGSTRYTYLISQYKSVTTLKKGGGGDIKEENVCFIVYLVRMRWLKHLHVSSF